MFFYVLNRLDIPGCRDVTMPVDETNEEITQNLKEKIKSGEYTLGEMIIPQKFIKTTMTGNTLEKEEVEISGRKIGNKIFKKEITRK